jgi:hypothetical protein
MRLTRDTELACDLGRKGDDDQERRRLAAIRRMPSVPMPEFLSSRSTRKRFREVAL